MEFRFDVESIGRTTAVSAILAVTYRTNQMRLFMSQLPISIGAF